MNAQVKIYTQKDKVWTNASNDKVPVKFIPQCDKTKEVLSAKIYKAALGIEASLATFHKLVEDASIEVLTMIKQEFELKQTKKQTVKSFTWYNFDRSIKIEADANDIVKWDNALLAESLILFNEYVDSELPANTVFIRGLVSDGFSNSKGGIDTRKIFLILKYEKKVPSLKYKKACELIKQAQSIDKTKLYHRVWEKMDNGEYRNINLQFSTL